MHPPGYRPAITSGMRAMGCFFIFSALGIFLGLQNQQQFKPFRTSGHLNYLPGLPPGQTTSSAIWRAMVTGDDSSLKRDTKKTYYQLGLAHLFTPSGAHLATMSPFVRFFGLRNQIYLPLALLGIFIPSLLALSRVAWLKGLSDKKLTPLKFIAILVLEGVFFSWRSSPASWTCSWMFLGITYFAPRYTLALWYLQAQLLLSWIFHQQFSLLSFPAMLTLGLMFIAIFPFILVCSFLPWSIFHQFILLTLELIHDSVITFSLVHTYVPPIDVHVGHLVFTFALVILPGRHKILSAVLLLLMSSPLGPWERERTSLSKWETTPIKEAHLLIAISARSQITTKWSDGTSCRHKLVLGSWEESCRAKKVPGSNRSLRKLSSLK